MEISAEDETYFGLPERYIMKSNEITASIHLKGVTFSNKEEEEDEFRCQNCQTRDSCGINLT